MSEPYKIVSQGVGCHSCLSGEQYDIVGPDESAQSQSWGNLEQAEYICALLNIAHQHGRVSYAQETLKRLEEELNATKQTEVKEERKTFRTTTPEGEDIPF